MLLAGTLASSCPAAVFVNQVGYRPLDPKAFVTDAGEQDFQLIRASTGRPVLEGRTVLRRAADPATGLNLHWGDFSELTEPGTYRVRLADGSESHVFEVGQDVYVEPARLALKSFTLARCGVPLEPAWAGEFARAACHTEDAPYHPELGWPGHKPTTGGWHDAGDYGKYVHSASVALAHMMLMVEWIPAAYRSDALGIPESGNGIPDLLDELAVELDWMLTMQVAEDHPELAGGVHYMVNTREYEWVTADADTAERFVYQVASVSTASFAAAMAMAARVFASEPTLQVRAAHYREAALRAWEFLLRHPGLYPETGFIRPADTRTGGYADRPDLNDRDERLWAAVELAVATGDPAYITALEGLGDPFLRHGFFDASSFSGELRWNGTEGFAFMQAALRPVAGLDEQRRGAIRNRFLAYCKALAARIASDGFGVALDRYYWGATGGTLALGQTLIMGLQLAPEHTGFRDGALHQLHYVLGRNALNTSFVSGVGSRFPMAIHHAAYANDGLERIVSGLLAGGPNAQLGNDEILSSHFSASTPPALCYVDHLDSYASNENCIVYNAPLVALAFYFAGPSDTPGPSAPMNTRRGDN